MTRYASIPVNEGNTLDSLNALFQGLLKQGIVDLLLVPQRLPGGVMVQQTLVADPDKIQGADPMAAILPSNSAPLVRRSTR